MYLTASETADSLHAMLSAFQRLNESWPKTCVIMTDKDMTERRTLSELFPDATLQLCLFHTLRSFKREFSMEKMGLRSGMRDTVLNILAGTAHAKSSVVYEEQYSMLQSLQLPPVIEYFDKNWMPIKEEWASCYKNSKFTLGEQTNNRLESMNGKIKSVCSKFASLDTFFSEFFVVLQVLRGERTHSHVMQRVKTPANPNSRLTSDDVKYANYATPYAYALIEKQLLLRDAVTVPEDGRPFQSSEGTISTTSSSCQCSFWTTRRLPCRHIFAMRKLQKLPSFDATLVDDRWSARLYREACGQKVAPCVGGTGTTIQELTSARPVLSAHQKYAAALAVGKDLASLASEVGTTEFNERLAFLVDLRRCWTDGPGVRLASTCKYQVNEYFFFRDVALNFNCTVEFFVGKL